MTLIAPTPPERRPDPPAPRPTGRRRARLHQLVRYSAVSAVSTGTSLTTLVLLVGLAAMPAGWANLVATGVGTIPSFELNRRWVWVQKGRSSLARQIVPFTLLSFTGLVLSSLTVHVAAGHTAHWGRGAHTAAVELASMTAFGALWVLQFVILDRILFRHRGGTDGRPTARRRRPTAKPSAPPGRSRRGLNDPAQPEGKTDGAARAPRTQEATRWMSTHAAGPRSTVTPPPHPPAAGGGW